MFACSLDLSLLTLAHDEKFSKPWEIRYEEFLSRLILTHVRLTTVIDI